MKEIPADMRSKFMKYESGKQTIQSSAGDDEERGFMRMSGTGMEPVEESYVKKPMGLQEFFKRTPEGRFQMAWTAYTPWNTSHEPWTKAAP